VLRVAELVSDLARRWLSPGRCDVVSADDAGVLARLQLEVHDMRRASYLGGLLLREVVDRLRPLRLDVESRGALGVVMDLPRQDGERLADVPSHAARRHVDHRRSQRLLHGVDQREGLPRGEHPVPALFRQRLLRLS
jgi:hypothetical protein